MNLPLGSVEGSGSSDEARRMRHVAGRALADADRLEERAATARVAVAHTASVARRVRLQVEAEDTQREARMVRASAVALLEEIRLLEASVQLTRASAARH